MAYTKTTWIDGSAPAINATNLNKIEQGIEDASNRTFALSISSNVITLTCSDGTTSSITLPVYDGSSSNYVLPGLGGGSND